MKAKIKLGTAWLIRWLYELVEILAEYWLFTLFGSLMVLIAAVAYGPVVFLWILGIGLVVGVGTGLFMGFMFLLDIGDDWARGVIRQDKADAEENKRIADEYRRARGQG